MQLGHPNEILQSTGIPDLPIEMNAVRLREKSQQENHPFELSEVENLPEALQNPIAIFESSTIFGRKIIFTELKHKNKNFVAILELERLNKDKILVNDIRSVYPRNSLKILKAINKGEMLYLDKEKATEWANRQQSNSAEAIPLLDSVTNVINNFKNPKINTQKNINQENPQNKEIVLEKGMEVRSKSTGETFTLYSLSDNDINLATTGGTSRIRQINYSPYSNIEELFNRYDFYDFNGNKIEYSEESRIFMQEDTVKPFIKNENNKRPSERLSPPEPVGGEKTQRNDRELNPPSQSKQGENHRERQAMDRQDAGDGLGSSERINLGGGSARENDDERLRENVLPTRHRSLGGRTNDGSRPLAEKSDRDLSLETEESQRISSRDAGNLPKDDRRESRRGDGSSIDRRRKDEEPKTLGTVPREYAETSSVEVSRGKLLSSSDGSVRKMGEGRKERSTGIGTEGRERPAMEKNYTGLPLGLGRLSTIVNALKDQEVNNEQITEVVNLATFVSENNQIELNPSLSEPLREALKPIVAQYKSGGISKIKGERGVLDEYYTNPQIVEAVRNLIYDNFKNQKNIRILEPSVGIGNFLNATKDLPNSNITAFEINETTAKIAKILHPKAHINLRSFETEFIDENGRKKEFTAEYDLVIGNPPYGKHRGYYYGLGEEAKISRYEDYFVKRSLDVLKEGGVLAMVLPSSYLNRQKKLDNAEIIQAFRLPNGAFKGTNVGTDILILKKNLLKNLIENTTIFMYLIIRSFQCFRKFIRTSKESLYN